MTTANPSPLASGGKVWKMPSADDAATLSKKNKHQKISKQVIIGIYSLAFLFFTVVMGLLLPFLVPNVSAFVSPANPSGGNDASTGYANAYKPFLIFEDPSSLGFLLLGFISMYALISLSLIKTLHKAIKTSLITLSVIIFIFAVSCSLHISKQSSDTPTLQSWMNERYGFTPTAGSNTTRLPEEGHIYKDANTGLIAETKKVGNGYYLFNTTTGEELPLKVEGNKQ